MGFFHSNSAAMSRVVFPQANCAGLNKVAAPTIFHDPPTTTALVVQKRHISALEPPGLTALFQNRLSDDSDAKQPGLYNRLGGRAAKKQRRQSSSSLWMPPNVLRNLLLPVFLLLPWLLLQSSTQSEISTNDSYYYYYQSTTSFESRSYSRDGTVTTSTSRQEWIQSNMPSSSFGIPQSSIMDKESTPLDTETFFMRFEQDLMNPFLE